MKAARDVRAGHQVEQGIIVAEPPDAEALAEISVEVDLAHPAMVPQSARRGARATPQASSGQASASSGSATTAR